MPVSQHKKDSYHHGDLHRALLDAASEELAASGLEAFSLRRVAARAGVSHAAPAHHFGDAAGLLTALAAEGYGLFVDAMKARQAQAQHTPEEQMLAAGLGYVDFALEHTALFRLIHGSKKTKMADPVLSAAGRAAYDHIAQLVSQVTGLAPDSAPCIARVAAIWAQAHGLADLISNGRMLSISSLSGAERDAALRATLQRVVLD